MYRKAGREESLKEEKYAVEDLLRRGETIQISPEGYSMYPMFVPGRDKAVLKQADIVRLKRGDVVLYRRPGSILVLHRLCRCTEEGFYMVGDNQVEVEGPLPGEQIIGVLTAFVHKGHHVSVRNPVYVACAGIWLFLRPVRRPFQLAAAFGKRTAGELIGIFRRGENR